MIKKILYFLSLVIFLYDCYATNKKDRLLSTAKLKIGEKLKAETNEENKTIKDILRNWETKNEKDNHDIVLKISKVMLGDKEIHVKRIIGAFNSGSIYCVFVTFENKEERLVFIFKEIINMLEASGLRMVSESDLIRNLPYLNQPEILHWTFPEKIFKGIEIDEKFNDRDFAIIHSAKGQSLWSIMIGALKKIMMLKKKYFQKNP